MKSCKADMIDNSLKVLKDMLACNTFCFGDWTATPSIKCRPEDFLEWQHRNLPALNYVTDRIVDYIFSNGFTTGDVQADTKLDEWMYGLNIRGEVNYNVLRNAVKQSMIYGKMGVRWLSYEDGIVGIDHTQYGELLNDNKEYRGFKDIVGYIVATDDDEYIWDIDMSDITYSRDLLYEYGILGTEDERIIVLDREEFLSLKWMPNDPDGKSPLLFDRQRLNLLISGYERLNYDIEFDGPGRILIPLAGSTGDEFGNEIDATKVIGNSEGVKKARRANARKEIEGIANQVKNSTSDQVIVLSDIFDAKNIKHLPRVTKGTEFFNYISNEAAILCQVFGVPPALLEEGRVYGNVSMQKIIDNGILNSIVPIREKYATPISNFLANKLGFTKFYFNKYELEQSADQTESVKKQAETIKILRDTGNAKDALLADMIVESISADIEEANEPATLAIPDVNDNDPNYIQAQIEERLESEINDSQEVQYFNNWYRKKKRK